MLNHIVLKYSVTDSVLSHHVIKWLMLYKLIIYL